MEELKQVVTTALEKQGVLAKLRAELRASVFQAIEEEEGGGAIAKQSSNARLKKLLSSEHGAIMVGLVREFMTWAGLSFSLKVFDPEVSLAEKPSRSSLQQQLGLAQSEELPLIGALLEGFLSGGAPCAAAQSKGPEAGLRGPRPDPLLVGATNPSVMDRSHSDMSDPAASPYDVTTPSSAFLGQDDLTAGNKSQAPKSAARGRSPLGQGGSTSEEPDKTSSASFEIEDDGVDVDDADIEYDDDDDDDMDLPLPSDEPAQHPRASPSGKKEELRTSSELHSSSDSVSVPRLDPLPTKVLGAQLNPLDKPLLGPPGRATGGLTPLGAPSRPRLSSVDIKQDLLRQGLISPSQSPHNSQEIPDVGKLAQTSGDACGTSGLSGIPDEISVEEIDAFSGGASDLGSELSDNPADDSQTILASHKGGASMEFFASGLSASDRSGELDALGDADYFESAELG